MKTLHASMAAPRGLQGGQQFPAEPIGMSESHGVRRPGARGALIWAVVTSAFAASAVAFGAQVSTSYIYGIDDDSNLWVMALSGSTSGTSQLLGPSSLTAGAANGLAYDSVRQQLFGADTATGELYWWQQGATAFTTLGSISGTAQTGKVASAAYYNDAYWFMGQGSTGNVLGKLSLTYTGGVPAIASAETFTIDGMDTAASGGGDMVITPDGMLFAYSSPELGKFFSVDVNTAVSGTVGGYNLISTTSGTGLQLALGVGPTPLLYGHDRGTGDWFTVDASTGNTTQIPGFNTAPVGGNGFNDLAGSSIQAVPEPSTLVMAAIGGGIVFWQVSRRRRHRALHGKFGHGRENDPSAYTRPCAAEPLAA